MTDADYSFEVPAFDDFNGADDNADQWFEERKCTSMKKRKPNIVHGQPKTHAFKVTSKAKSKIITKGVQKAKNQVRSREPIVLPIRSEAPLTIPDTPEVLKKSKPKNETKYVSVAESTAQFFSRTPPRFRVASAKTKFRPLPAGPRLLVTKPHSPNFQPRRARNRIVPSSVELEEQLMQSIKPFKAQPVSREVLESKGDLGVPRIPARDVTVPMEFNFETQKRVELRPKTAADVKRDAEQFVAHPVPEHILHGGPTGVPEKKRKAPTVAHTPKITKAAPRPEPRNSDDEDVEEVEFHANPMPIIETVFKPQLPHKHTELLPFKVASKDPKVRRQQLLEEQIRREAAQRDFKASGLPSLSPAALPAVPPKPATIAEPFELPGERISERKRMDFAEKKMKEQSEALVAAQFHALPCKSTVTVPFEPKRTTKPLTERNFLTTQITQFEMATDKRAVERGQFDETLREKERIRQGLMACQEQDEVAAEERRQQEKREIAEMRRNREHKAQPIRHYKAVAPALQLSLTEPHSPAFSKKLMRA